MIDIALDRTSPFGVLSVAPCFDGDLADELLQLDIHATVGFDEIVSHGALERVKVLYRVPDPLRQRHRRGLREEDFDLYRTALGAFVSHGESSMADALSAVFGNRGAQVMLQSLRVVVSGEEGEQLNQLDRLLATNEERGRFADHSASARLLETYGDPVGRVARYLRGMSDWSRGDRDVAAAHFEFVVEAGDRDRMSAVAGHLLGSYLHDKGHTRESLVQLEVARELLNDLGDNLGYAVTTSTTSRVLLDRFRSLRDPEDLGTARKLAESAAKSAQSPDECNERPVLCAQARVASALALANTLIELKDFRGALDALHGVDVFVGPGSLDELRIAMIKARSLRDLGQFQPAEEPLVATLATWVGDTRQRKKLRAQALNVLASIQRHVDLGRALVTATDSLNLGLELKNDRHVAHATLTIAQITMAQSDWSSMELQSRWKVLGDMKGRLFAARSTLRDLNDQNGIRRVDEVLAEIDERYFE